MPGRSGNSLNAAVAATIRRLRLEKGLSQERLASQAGLDRTYVSGIERGRRNITLESLARVARCVSPSLSKFLEEVIRTLDG